MLKLCMETELFENIQPTLHAYAAKMNKILIPLQYSYYIH